MEAVEPTPTPTPTMQLQECYKLAGITIGMLSLVTTVAVFSFVCQKEDKETANEAGTQYPKNNALSSFLDHANPEKLKLGTKLMRALDILFDEMSLFEEHPLLNKLVSLLRRTRIIQLAYLVMLNEEIYTCVTNISQKLEKIKGSSNNVEELIIFSAEQQAEIDKEVEKLDSIVSVNIVQNLIDTEPISSTSSALLSSQLHDICVICLEKISDAVVFCNGSDKHFTSCFHSCCKNCCLLLHKRNLATNSPPRCPTCRQSYSFVKMVADK